ncbi:MAG TPA: hypothetical protein VLA21_08740, partial [Candidatus Limnocylindria bacterium]|nr:hypothetical protein [Candidatus Limnocylindria bacterium]
GYRGWMRAEYLRFDALPDAANSAIPTGYVRAVKGGVLQLQLNPYYGHNVGKYEAGTPARILGVTGGWAHVYMPNGQAGFIEIKNLDVPGGLRP